MEILSFLVSQEGKIQIFCLCVWCTCTHMFIHVCKCVRVHMCMHVYLCGWGGHRQMLETSLIALNSLDLHSLSLDWRWSIPLARLSSQLLWDPIPVPESWGYRWDTQATLILCVFCGVTHCFLLLPLSGLGKILLT